MGKWRGSVRNKAVILHRVGQATGEADDGGAGKSVLPGVGAEIAEALRNAGFDSVEAVAAASDEELLRVSGIGERRLASIREAMVKDESDFS